MSSLEKAAQTALKVCMGLKQNEKLLIIYDNKKTLANALSKEGKKITKNVKLLKIPQLKVNGQEPSKKTADEMLKHNVIMIITSKSLSHTKARRDSTKKGVRIVSMPGITKDIFIRGMNADYNKIKQRSKKLRILFNKAKKVGVTTKKGTNLNMGAKNRKGLGDTGIYHKKGDFGNLPSGESGVAPLEGTTNGIVIIDKTFAGVGLLKKPIKLVFKKGYAKITGGKEAQKLIKILEDIKNKDVYNIAEFAIGLNNKAKITGNILEDEKVYGTAHVALGNNKSYGGKIDVPIHLDGVFNKPTVFIDNKKIMHNGKLII